MKTIVKKPRAQRNYVNNKDLYEALRKYRDECELARSEERQPPRAPTYVGQAIMEICNRLAFRHNFKNYSYRDEMIDEAIENCVAALNNFNPDKSTNPFGYFTMVAYNAMVRRITKEKTQSYIKYKHYYHSLHNDLLVDGEGGSGEVADAAYGMHVIESFEERVAKSKKKQKKGLEVFAVDENAER